MKELKELRDMLCDELKEYGKKGELTAGSLSTVDTLAHALKNLDKVIEDEDGYSNHYPYYGGSYDMGGRGSYARRRDRMGRYSGERGYSRSDLSDKLRDLMDEAPDDRTRQEIQRMIDKFESA